MEFIFRREADLEHFILDNWDRLDFLNGYTLFKTPDGKMGNQLKISGLSTLDILCRYKLTGDFLIVELKYTAGSKDIDQVTRYIKEVEGKLARGNNSVRAMIVAQSFDPDVFTADHPRIDFIKLDFTVTAIPL